MISKDKVVSALEFAGTAGELIQAGRTGSLIEYSQPTRVEPTVLVDQRATVLPYLEDVLSSTLNIFSAYYLQAVSLSINVGNVNVLKTLDKLNPKRDPLRSYDAEFWGSGAGKKVLGMESRMTFFGGEYQAEAIDDDLREALRNKEAAVNVEYTETIDATNPASTVSNSIKELNDNANLSVGKLLDVQIEDGGKKASFPVQVRLHAITIRPEVLTHTLSLDSRKVSGKERYHLWRSGQIEFFKDLVLCQDMIDQHRKNLIDDASGYYKERTSGSKRNILSTILSGNPSVATASSIFVMTADTAKELEGKIRGKLSRFRDREKLFKETYGMLMVIIDPEWDQITVYHRTIERPTEVSVREMQRSNKNGKGPDISQIMLALLESKAPSI